jgi:oxygen-independent coproporphyrinogen-3 oxidase
MAYWLYWRAYEMKASSEDFRELFGEDIESMFRGLFALPRLFGMVKKENGTYRVTEKAAYWIHRLQNEYSLNYINRLWGRCRMEAWPQEVRL